MTQTTIYQVIGIQTVTLSVFHTEDYGWQFQVISSDGAVCGDRELY